MPVRNHTKICFPITSDKLGCLGSNHIYRNSSQICLNLSPSSCYILSYNYQLPLLFAQQFAPSPPLPSNSEPPLSGFGFKSPLTAISTTHYSHRSNSLQRPSYPIWRWRWRWTFGHLHLEYSDSPNALDMQLNGLAGIPP